MPETISYKLRTSRRARCLKVTVRCDGSVHVSAPPRVAKSYITAFVEKQLPWIVSVQEKYRSQPRNVPWNGSRDEYAQHRDRAMQIATERLLHFNTLYGFTWKRVTIRNQTTRWGSCSRRGHLSFNYRIALLAPELVDYLIVHELCHLGQFNHSDAFWALVERALPEYKKHRAELRRMLLA